MKKHVKMIMGVLTAIIVMGMLCACGKTGGDPDAKVSSYEVLLPEGYETEDRSYPVVYVMPQDGYQADDSNIAEKLHEQMEAIIVKGEYAELFTDEQVNYCYELLCENGYY